MERFEMSDPCEEVQAEGGRDVYGFQTERWWSVREEHREGVFSVYQQLVVFYSILEAILRKEKWEYLLDMLIEKPSNTAENTNLSVTWQH